MRRVLNWFGSEKGKGAGFSFLSAGNFLIAFFTYLRFAEIARIFGTTWQTDAVSIAMVIPLLLQQLISTAFGSAFMPIYSRVRQSGGIEAANRLVSMIINWMSISGVLMVGAVLASGSTVVSIVGPGADGGTLALATGLLNVFLPLIFLNALEGVLQNFLVYGNRYGLVSFVRVLQILVSYVVLLAGHGESGIMIIPISGIAGAFVSFMTCAAFSFRLRLRLHVAFDPGDRNFRDLVRLAVPITIGVVTGFLGPVADKALASFLRASSVTAIDYASRVKNLVNMIMIQPVVVLCTVSFSKIAAKGDLDRLRGEISTFIRYISYYAVPVAGILTVLAVPLISVFFQRGNFGPEQSDFVGYALAYYSPWFAQFGIGLIIGRAFYALKDTVTPVILGIWGMLCNILLNFILLMPMGIGGLALATTVTSTAKTLMLMYSLRRKMGGIGGREFIPEYLKILLSTLVMVGYIVLAVKFVPIDLHSSLSSRIGRLAVAILPGACIYVGTTALLRSRTFGDYLEILRRKLGIQGGPPGTRTS
ncbi:MAG: polysaccharide biosynthesis C-terminal domain-containing protein [Candidatus Fermentibacteraceae bacterium]|nr:polysaccharide biosynthesis C-terminal domain-containing protein [Candidatus Fermentibacteraceae bacterium]MBN2609231.1 polysaccharide biosynthesis C-terminal domain-containing protein [Candidatus Fermentibacteraceae bacterium]